MASNRGKFTGPSVAARSNIYAPSTARNKPQKAAPPPTYNVKLVLLMPMPGHGFTALELLNIDVDAAFEQIRDQFQVTITVLDDGDMIEIKAFNRKKANDAVRALRKILERKPGDRIVWRPLALIKPLSSGNDNGQIALIPNEGIEGARPFAIVKAGHSSESTDDKDGTQYKEELQKALARAVENLRYVPNRMRMRINFGHVLLKEWKKDQSEYTFAELKQMAHRAGPRGTVHMHTHIGHDNTVSRIKEQLRLIEDCVPQDIRINTTEDTPPSISLVLLTKNLVTESVIDFARGKSEIDSKERVTYKYVLGPMSVFHRERRARAVTIMTSCPEESFDWCLEVQSQVDSSKTPFPFQDKALRENVQFKDAAVTNRFPTININPYFLRANGVDVIIGKTSWTYLIKSRYVLEVGLYHQWHKDVKSKPSTGAVVSLYGCEWDYETEPADISKGPRDWTNFADNFLKSGSDDSDTFEDLTSLVSQVQAVLAEATKGDS
ncbi:hypothetical protein V8F06_012006 [Rhypophila decipiens]